MQNIRSVPMRADSHEVLMTEVEVSEFALLQFHSEL